MATEVASLVARFSADTSQFKAGLQEVSSGTREAGRNIQHSLNNAATGMRNVGLSMVAMATPVVAGFGAAINTAIGFESAMAGVAKTVDLGEGEFADLQRTIRRMATSADNPLAGLDNAHVAIANIMELGGQLGVASSDLEGFATTVGQLAMSTNLTTEEAATMAAQFANITGMDMSNLEHFGDVIVTLGNNSATTEKDIMNMAMRIAAAGTGAGLSVDEILGFSAAMASTGLQAEAAGTAFTTFVTKIGTGVAEGGADLDEFARVAGMSASEFAEQWETGPEEAIQAFIGGLADMDQAARTEALTNLGLSGIRVSEMLNRMANGAELVAETLGLAQDSVETAGALSEEAGQRFGTTKSQLNLLKNMVADTAIVIGFIFLPSIILMASKLGDVVLKVGEWAEENPGLVQSVALVAVGVLGLGVALGTLGLVLSPIVTGIGLLAVAIGLLTTPIGLAILAVAGLGLVWGTNFGDIQTITIAVVDEVKRKVGELPTSIGSTLKSIPGKIKGHASGIKTGLSSPFKRC